VHPPSRSAARHVHPQTSDGQGGRSLAVLSDAVDLVATVSLPAAASSPGGVPAKGVTPASVGLSPPGTASRRPNKRVSTHPWARRTFESKPSRHQLVDPMNAAVLDLRSSWISSAVRVAAVTAARYGSGDDVGCLITAE
jgi:hypothetical protein